MPKPQAAAGLWLWLPGLGRGGGGAEGQKQAWDKDRLQTDTFQGHESTPGNTASWPLTHGPNGPATAPRAARGHGTGLGSPPALVGASPNLQGGGGAPLLHGGGQGVHRQACRMPSVPSTWPAKLTCLTSPEPREHPLDSAPTPGYSRPSGSPRPPAQVTHGAGALSSCSDPRETLLKP